jgi:HAD superfamily hydrolase (TIGR01549 family)
MPLVSVIVPVYNTESLLPRCLDSLMDQTYKNIEVIVVDDKSPGNVCEIVQKYQKIDGRIKLVRHESNKGLFHARLSGAELAQGEFIAFLDSDDYLAVDSYRLLVNKAMSADADIVYMNFVFENEKQEKWIANLNRPFFSELHGEHIFDEFMKQEGKAFFWHVVWNKLINKKLWDKCVPYYRRIKDHLIMTEDLVYSSVLLFFAKKLAVIEYDGIFYYQRSDASTSNNGTMEKYEKNIRDLETSFSFFENFLREMGCYNKYNKNFKEWNKLYYRYWVDNIKHSKLNVIEKKKILYQLGRIFGLNDELGTNIEDHYFGSRTTPWDDRYETLKRLILKNEYKVISFDIFDTLIQRPFFEPHDLFRLLDPYYEEQVNRKNCMNFSEMRREAELLARAEKVHDFSMHEEVTIDEIYDLLSKKYSINKNVCDLMKQKEIELELNYCVARESVKELYEMAKQAGKRIILVSDMYLPSSVIKIILHKNGYSDYERLYLSSESRISKQSSNLFKKVLNDLDLEPSEIFHIGDNWHSDHKQASSLGVRTWVIPKAIDVLMSRIPGTETGKVGQFFEYPSGMWENYKYATQYFGIRVMLGTVAIKHFDNPYLSFNRASDFNANPKLIGYFAFGMHLFGLARWLLDDAMKAGYETIHFVARDGYFVKQAYDLLSKQYRSSPKSNYLYLSRKALLPVVAMEESPYVLSRFTTLHNQTPRSIIKDMLNIELPSSGEEELIGKGVVLDKYFSGDTEFNGFIGILNESLVYNEYAKPLMAEYSKIVKKYFDSIIGANDVLFDIGYSGTSQMILSKILKRPVDAYYIHTNHDKAYDYANRFKFRVKTFYDFSPAISGPVREYIISETGPSCIGYLIENDTIKPKFEEKNSSYIEEWLLGQIHQSALKFVEDITNLFGFYLDMLTFRNKEVSAPFEYFLHYGTEFDRSLFSACSFEDHIFHGSKEVSIYGIWNDHLLRYKIVNSRREELRVVNSLDFLNDHSKYMKGLFYFLFLRDVFKEKVKRKLMPYPKVLRIAKLFYRAIRSIKRSIIRT